MQIQYLPAHHTEFPEALAHAMPPPAGIYVQGNLSSLLQRPRLAVVGSRKVSPYGRAVTKRITAELAGLGIVIISGLALGTDALAHSAALEADGRTIAVLPGGLDNIYPATNRTLASKILEQGGVLLSEYAAGQRLYPMNFIGRNRLIAALADGVLIPEAALKSGSLHTARFALEQGKAVMAIPGNITSELSAGTNNLLRSGAALIQNSQDVLHALGLESNTIQNAIVNANSEEEHTLLTLIKNGHSDGSELQRASRLEPDRFNQVLTMLEITGRVACVGGNHWIAT